ncbi:hypothetical protein JZ751_003213 [Albula glossodonta]|uniref:B(0,+)-type amino acid transporter 1 n=1 Tax=Albula glossodonta TaxID=121402 RepID=A0A8T2N934_9TELE|nr:hypothetical protein JZ751_003213 [Albula glossodonta]
MIGSGIFMSPQTVLLNVRSPGASLMIWAACGILVMLASLCYAELGTVIRKSGGTYIYITKTWGQPLAFKYIFICVLVMFPSSIAGLALSFAEYAVAPFYQGCPPPLLVVKCAAASGIIMLSIVNSLNVRFSVYIQVFCLVAKVLALVVIVIGGVLLLVGGHTENFENSFEGTKSDISPIGVAFYQGLWSYNGWSNLNYVIEELQHLEVSICAVGAMAEGKAEKLNLKREVGLVSAVSLIVGTMIGSGIFMSPQFVISNIGSPGASLVVWALCGLVAMLGALSYAELGTIIPESGGDFIYILRIYGKAPAFFVAFTFVLVVKPFSMAAMALSFAEYAMAPLYADCAPPQLAVKCTAFACILVVATANILNVRFAMSIQVVFTVAKLAALVVIVIGGMVLLAQGSTASFHNAVEGTHLGLSPIGTAFYQGLWSYAGWYNLNYVTEELKQPEKDCIVDHVQRKIQVGRIVDWLMPRQSSGARKWEQLNPLNWMGSCSWLWEGLWSSAQGESNSANQ